MVFQAEKVRNRMSQFVRKQKIHSGFLSKIEQSHRGFTLIELIAVIVLVAILARIAIGNVDSVLIWRYRTDLRRFANTWQFLYDEAIGTGHAYRLIIDFEGNTYRVRREIRPMPKATTQTVDVDYLSNLRTQGEKKRRKEKENEEILSLEEQFKEDDLREGSALDDLFYQYLFGDPNQPVRLGTPLDFPELAEPRTFTSGLRFRDIRTLNGISDEDEVSIRFSPRGASEFAVVHLDIEDSDYVFTVFANPSTGEVSLREGDMDFTWTLGRTEER